MPRWLCLAIGAVVGVTIIVGSLLPRGLHLLPWYMPGLTHVLAYGSMAFLLAIAAGREWQWAVLMGLTGLGVGIEVAQHLVPLREAHLTDALLNLGGICVGLVMAEIVRWAYLAATGRLSGRPVAGSGE